MSIENRLRKVEIQFEGSQGGNNLHTVQSSPGGNMVEVKGDGGKRHLICSKVHRMPLW